MAKNQSAYWEESARNDEAGIVSGWCFSEDEIEPPPIRVLPDGQISVLFSAPSTGESWEAVVLGATTKASVVRQREPRLQIQARLTPGSAASVFGVDLSALRDGSVPLSEFWGTRVDALLDVLAKAKSWTKRRTAIEGMFARGVTYDVPGGDLVLRATAEIRRRQGQLRISELCSRLEIHPRRLERLFAYHQGLSPKLLTRIVRFRAAREAIRAERPAMEVALSAGYSDQAHMTREFQAFAGVPPSLIGSAVVFVHSDGDVRE